ncbi:xylulokinase [Sporobacter termitidis DSM 10068]|uniref:Xylulose kinase n=1 Tax=Sporobacter termitidis DSM 10068 TaxID=1123282 RepID=A0A1M5ZFH7_9FIRM|nr:xylulokinase [Sporobacter termitidis]SHI23008.1 xylulokinase [Sporobacter termitidis DSM 10068]
MLYIGIDLGTSAVKLLLVDGAGKILKCVSRGYPIAFPRSGWAEQNPEDWLRETIAGILELTDGCDKAQIAGIGAGGQMHGLVALDKDDNVLRPAILWNDGRAAEETDYLNNAVGRETLSRLTGNIAFAGFTAPKLLWLERNEPALFGRVDKIMLPKDYINYKLTGVHCTDYSDASGTLLLDVEHRRWSREMLDICAVREEWLPRLFESFAAVGTLTPAMAGALGLSPGVKVAAGAGDNAAAAVGTGTVGSGRCNISVGTSGTVFISRGTFGPDKNNALHAFAHADGRFHLMGCMLSAASCNKWWMEDILRSAQYGSEQAPVTRDRLGCSHVYFLPYLMGERSPHNDPAARGALIGLSMDSTRADITQAVLEGVAFGLRDMLEAARAPDLRIERSKICGGGARSPLWKEIIANVLNLELECVETEEGPSYGGAILAAVACGEYRSVQEAAEKLVKVASIVKPDADIAARYDARYQVYRDIYPALKPLGKRL